MANKKISEFNTATAADPTDLLLIQRGSGNFSLAIDTLNASSSLTVQDTGVDVETGVTNIDFIGGGVVVTSTGSGAVQVDVSAAGVSDWIDLSDTPVAYATFGGYATRVNGSESGLEFFDFDPTVRGLISIAPGSSSHLGYDSLTGEISIKALGITSVTVNGSSTSLANFVSTFYTVGTEFQEGDTIILNGVPSGQEVYIHNGGSAGDATDFTLLEQPQVTSYLGLTDTPGSFSGDANEFVRVNAGASGLEHVAAGSINVGDFNNDGTYLTSVTGTASRISISGGDTIDIDAAYVGQTSITTLGTIGTGTWNASTIGETVGGTGQTTYATGDILYASGANTLSKLAAGTDTHVLTLVGGVPVWAAAAGGADGNGIYTGSGSLSGPTTVTIGTQDLTFNGTASVIMGNTTGGSALIYGPAGNYFQIQNAGLTKTVQNHALTQSNTGITTVNAPTGQFISFRNNNVEGARLDANGVSIGTGAAPLARLQVQASSGQSPLRVDTNTVTNALTVASDGKIGIGATPAIAGILQEYGSNFIGLYKQTGTTSATNQLINEWRLNANSANVQVRAFDDAFGTAAVQGMGAVFGGANDLLVGSVGTTSTPQTLMFGHFNSAGSALTEHGRFFVSGTAAYLQLETQNHNIRIVETQTTGGTTGNGYIRVLTNNGANTRYIRLEATA